MLSLLSEHKLELFLLEIWGRNESLLGDMLVPLVIRDLVRDNGMLIKHTHTLTTTAVYYASGDRYLTVSSSWSPRVVSHIKSSERAMTFGWLLSWEIIIKTPNRYKHNSCSQLRLLFSLHSMRAVAALGGNWLLLRFVVTLRYVIARHASRTNEGEVYFKRIFRQNSLISWS